MATTTLQETTNQVFGKQGTRLSNTKIRECRHMLHFIKQTGHNYLVHNQSSVFLCWH